jgi:hypothetical protein
MADLDFESMASFLAGQDWKMDRVERLQDILWRCLGYI